MEASGWKVPTTGCDRWAGWDHEWGLWTSSKGWWVNEAVDGPFKWAVRQVLPKDWRTVPWRGSCLVDVKPVGTQWWTACSGHLSSPRWLQKGFSQQSSSIMLSRPGHPSPKSSCLGRGRETRCWWWTCAGCAGWVSWCWLPAGGSSSDCRAGPHRDLSRGWHRRSVGYELEGQASGAVEIAEAETVWKSNWCETSVQGTDWRAQGSNTVSQVWQTRPLGPWMPIQDVGKRVTQKGSSSACRLHIVWCGPGAISDWICGSRCWCAFNSGFGSSKVSVGRDCEGPRAYWSGVQSGI